MNRLAITIPALLASVAFAQEPVDFYGIPMGASPATWQQKWPAATCRLVPIELLALADSTCYISPAAHCANSGRPGNICEQEFAIGFTFAGRNLVYANATYLNNAMFRVTAALHYDDLLYVLAALNGKYGKATRQEEETFNDIDGKPTKRTLTVWDTGAVKIVLMNKTSKPGEIQVIYTLESVIKEIAARAKASQAK